MNMIIEILRRVASVTEDALYISQELSGESHPIVCIYDLPRITCEILMSMSQKLEWL
jgi:hypothetical protein